MTFDEFKAAVEAAERCWQNGDWGAALGAFRTLVRDRLADVGSAEALQEADLIVVQRLADLAVPFGETAAADNLLAALSTLYRQRGLQGRADHVGIKRLHLALGADRLQTAREALLSLEPSLGRVTEIDLSAAGLAQWESQRTWPRAERAVLFTQLYLGMGRLLAALGQYGDAIKALERGRFHAAEGSPPLAQEADLPLRLALAAARLEQGDLRTAAADLDSLALNELEHPGLAVRRCELLAKLCLLRGELRAAVDQLERGAAISGDRGFRRAALWSVANLAHVRVLLNQTQEAERLLEMVREGAQALPDPALGRRAALLSGLAKARGGSLLGDEPTALAVAEMQQGVAPAEPSSPEPPVLRSGSPRGRSASFLADFEDQALEILIALSQQDLGGAVDLLEAIQRGFQDTDSVLVRGLIEIRIAMMYYYRGRSEPRPEIRNQLLEHAERRIRQALPVLRSLGLKPEIYQAQRFLGWCQRSLQRPAAERDALASANQALLEEIAGSLPVAERAAYLVNKWQATEEALAVELNEIVEERRKMARASLPRRLALRWKILRRLNALLDRIHLDREALAREAAGETEVHRRPGTFFSLSRRLLLHPLRRATLTFLVLPDRIFLARLSWMSIDFKVIPLRRLQVRELVRTWHEAVLGVSASAAERAVRTLDEELGIGEILACLPRRVHSLTVVPDDALHGFPFAALPYQGGYLVERFAVSMSYQSTARRLRQRKDTRRRALVAGVDLPVGDLPALPATGRQLRRVIEWLARRRVPARPVVNHDVSRSFLVEEIPRAGLCHLSCHGVFRPEAPDATGLVLLPQGGKEQILSLRDLLGLRLDGVRHVTLVSCWAADNFIFPGRWIVSLPEILWRQGAASVVGCLWEVEDRSAVQFLRRFYTALDRLPRDQALRHAQIRALRDRRTADPLVWAGFQLYGDPGKLRL